MITAKDVRTVLGQLAEAKHQDFYIDFTGDLLHSMAAPRAARKSSAASRIVDCFNV